MTEKLPLKDVLNSLDYHNKTFYDNLSVQQKKEFQPYPLLRFMSSGGTNGELHRATLMVTNEIANKYFWDMNKDMQVALLYSIGFNMNVFHKWIPTKNKKSSPLGSFIYDIHSDKNIFLKDDEIGLFISKLTLDSLKSLLLEYGILPDDEKKIIKEYKSEWT